MKKLFLIVFLILVLALSLCACDEAYKLSFASDTITVSVGTSFKPDMVIRPRNAEYSLSVDNVTIASVSDNVVTTKREGVFTLTATSGDKEAKTTVYVVNEDIEHPNNVVVVTTYVVSFEIVNYQIAGLDTGAIEGVYAYENSVISVNLPTVWGYIVSGWYVDKECTTPFDENTKITSSFTLYCRLTERETAYNVVNNLVVGLLYPNLKHEELTLPEGTAEAPIYGIADEAFMGDEGIKKVIIPASYRTIGTSAFAGCKNLEEVVIPTGSTLNIIGDNAFGVLRDRFDRITDGCEKLTTLVLPDTVTKIGAFAFYNCSLLPFDGIPAGLTDVEQYSFAGTKINNVSLANVNTVFEGAFYNCSDLDTVTDTEDVGRCYKLAFAGTKLINVAQSAYNASRNENDLAYYAGTILFGCNKLYGKGIGSGKLHIKETTTLIADEAFNNENQSELTLYIDTEIASSSLNRDFLGQNLFVDSDGVFLVVEAGKSSAFRSRYGENNQNRNYAEKFVEEEIVEVAGNADTVNYGKHILLKKTDSTGTKYYYDKFVQNETATRIIRIDELPVVHAIVRINMGAFNNLSALEILGLGKVASIAYFGVNNCPVLSRIELNNTITPAILEHELSIKLGDMPSAYVYVKPDDLTAYRMAWASYPTAYERLRAAE